MPSYVPLVNEYRGELLDLVRLGYICVVDADSKVLWHAGDPDEMVFYRSSSKPLQALPAIARGLDKKYGLTHEETAIFAGSHQGDTFHVAALESVFRKAGMTEDQLCLAPTLPQVPHDSGFVPRKFCHNCSGKHTATMLLQRDMGGDLKDYWRVDAPAQREIKRAVAVLSEFDEEKVGIGLDGCGVPVFAVGMKNIAAAFKNLALPGRIKDDALARAAADFVPRMHAYPNMVRGVGQICSLLNAIPGIVAKSGANGLYAMGLKDMGIGISIKLVDGTNSVWPMIIAGVLRHIGYDNEYTYEVLDKLCPAEVYKNNGDIAGTKRNVFELIKG